MVVALELMSTRPAAAADPPSSGAGTSPDDRRARAKELFDLAFARTLVEDWAGALALFEESRLLFPKRENTKNVAICLENLGRYDEAREMYQALLVSFPAQIGAAERSEIERDVARLRQMMASLEVSANVVGQIAVDETPLAELPRVGPLRLRVRAGAHQVRISSRGFKSFERTMNFAGDDHTILYSVLELLPPPPPPPPRPYLFLSGFAGYAISSSLGSTAEEKGVDSRQPVVGFMAGIRGGYRLTQGFAFEASVGYIAVATMIKRHLLTGDPSAGIIDSADPHASFALTDTLRLSGAFLAAGGSFRVPLNARFDFLARTSVGVIASRSTDFIEGIACATTPCGEHDANLPAVVNGNGRNDILIGASAVIMPELGLDARWGDLQVGLALGLFILTAPSPSFQGREVGVNPNQPTPMQCPTISPQDTVACVPNLPLGTLIKDDPSKRREEVAYGAFATFWVPQLVVGYSF